MTRPQTEITSRSPQELYPLLHLFYHLVLAGKLFHLAVYKKSQTRMMVSERLAAYRELTHAEKYFFLLETLWLDCSLSSFNGRSGFIPVTECLQAFLEKVCQLKPGEPFFCKTDSDFHLNAFFLSPPLLFSFSFFGWYELVRDEERSKYLSAKRRFPIQAVISSPLGTMLSRKLVRERALPDWNLPHLRSEGFLPATPEMKAIAASNFVDLFRPFCAENELRRSLPRESGQTTSGNFIFKVSIAPKVWRVLALSHEHTLDDLHNLIQDAFKFDDDHLYAFYMDNKRYSEEHFESPRGEEGPFADEIAIGDLELKKANAFFISLTSATNGNLPWNCSTLKPRRSRYRAPRFSKPTAKRRSNIPMRRESGERNWRLRMSKEVLF